MAITVQLKYSDTPGKVPVLGDLVLGELGLNSYDGKLFAKKKQGATEVIIELGKVFVDASAQDVINVSNNNVFSPGSDANKLVFWDHSQSKLSYLALGEGLAISGGFLTALGETNLSYDATSNTVLSSTGTGAVIPVATVSLSGLQSFSDKTKLDGIEPGATANSTDSQLRDRATHTGTQGFSTVSSVTKGSLLGRYSAGTGPAELISVGYGLTLDGGEILNSLDYQTLAVPTGFEVTGSGTESITISFSPGYSLPTTNSQTNWDIAYNQRLQWDGGSTNLDISQAFISLGLGNSATKNVGTASGTVAAGNDSRFTTNLGYNSTLNQLTSSTGSGATLPLATSFDAGLQSASDKSKLDGIAAGATANDTDAQLRDRATHTGSQSYSTLSSITNNSFVGRYSGGTGSAELISLGQGLGIQGGSLVNTRGYPSLSAPVGFSVTGSETASIGLAFSPGYSLPTTTDQSKWNDAYSQRLQWDGGSTNLNVGSAFISLGLGSAATKNVGTSAGTVASGDDGRFVTNLGYTALTRVLTSSTGSGVTLPLATTSAPGLLSYSDKTKLDGLATVASTGSYSDLTGKPSLGSAASLDSGTSPGNVPVLDGSGKLASSTLPSYVDDVVEVANFAALPLTGEAGKIYVTLDNNKTYRWGGSSYVEISASPGSTDAVPEGTTNLYFTSARASAAAPVQSVAGRTGAVTLSVSDVSGALSSADAALTYQPLDSDLTSIAALSTTTFGRSLLTQADQSATLTTIGAAPSIHGHSVFTSSSSGYVPASGGGTTNFLRADGTFAAPPSGSGTVTSVGLSLPSILNVSNSPVTSSGTLTATLAAQGANQVFAGPSSGPASTPTFRQLGYSELSGTDGSITDAKITTAGLSASSVNWTSITAWAPNTLYTKGDLVEYQGIAYRRISTGFSDPSFNGTNWNQTTSSAVISHGHSTFTSTSSGYVPASGGGTTKFLRADGTFVVPPNVGSGYLVNNWIQPAFGTVAAGNSVSSATIYLYPFTVLRSITVSELGARVTAVVAGATFQLAVYGSNASNLPSGNALASTASLPASTATAVSGVVSSLSLNAGQIYWGAFSSDGAVTMQHLSGANSYFNSILGSASLTEVSSGAAISSWIRTYVGASYGTWPDLTSASTTLAAGSGTLRGAVIYFKVSSIL